MQQFSRETLEAIIKHEQEFEAELALGLRLEKEVPRESVKRSWRIRTLFYEPSTRTSTTFEDAANLLGCSVHQVKDPGTFSSAVKGESFEEALAAFTLTGGLGHMRGTDVIVLRHGQDGASERAVKVIETAQREMQVSLPLPIINAGDGTGQHPTQALVDLATIFQERKENSHPLENVTILFPGDLERSRVINSLLYALGKFGPKHNIHVIFCCPEGFEPKSELLEYLARNRVTYEFFKPKRFQEAIGKADIVYMTRIQRERKSTSGSVFRQKWRQRLVFRREYLELLHQNAFVMHPLPINRDSQDPPAEIDHALWPLAQAGHKKLAWMRQSLRGLPTRTALLDLIFVHLDNAVAQIISE